MPEAANVPIRAATIRESETPDMREARDDVEDRGHFSKHTYSNSAGRRQYGLYVPADSGGEPLPLIAIMAVHRTPTILRQARR